MKKYYLFAAGAIFCWSTMATVVKLLLGTMDSMQVLFVSSLFAALFLLAVSLFTGKIRLLKDLRFPDYLKMAGIGLPGIFLYNVFYYTGASMMLASQAFIVNYLWPIMSVIFACLLLKEKLTVRKVIAILLSFTGVIIVISKDLAAFDRGTLIGAVFCALGAASYGLFTALNKKSRYDESLSTMVSYFATFLLCGVYVLAKGAVMHVTFGQIMGLAWNGVFILALANMMWLLALGAGDTAKISNLAYITPFLSLIWTAVILKEEITLSSIIGLVVIVLGILIQLLQKKSHHS